MSNALLIYRPTVVAIAANAKRGGDPLPLEIHVHPSGMTVATYAASVDVHFPTIYGVYEKHGVSAADFDQIP